MKSSAAEIYQLSFQNSPIILTNGLAGLILGGMLPIISITEALSFFDGLLSGGGLESPDEFFAHFKVMPGATLVTNQYGEYPFANQSVAANAVIAQPLKVSLLMTLQIRNLAARLATMTALEAALTLHSNTGGSYTVATPSYLYTNCVLRNLACVGDVGTQSQVVWQWDFEQPLLTQQQAAIAMNGMMSQINGGLPSSGATSGIGVVSGPFSLAAPSISPAASGLSGANVAGFLPS